MEQLKLLMDYTIFHMGVYISLGGLMIALLGIKAFEAQAKTMLWYLIFALACFMLAGMCGGIIAGNIPYAENLKSFIDSQIGIWVLPFTAPAWLYIRIEHTAFWVGIFVFLFGFWWSSPVRST